MIRNHFLAFFGVKILKFFDEDPGSGMETVRIRDPGWKKVGSGINIPDPPHCLLRGPNIGGQMDLHVRFEIVFALILCRALIATQSSYRLCAQACDIAAWPPDKKSLDNRDRES